MSFLSEHFKHLPGATWRVYIVSARYISSTVSDNFPPSHYPSLSLSLSISAHCMYEPHTQPPPPLSLSPAPPPPPPPLLSLHPSPSQARAPSSPIRLALAGSFCLPSNCPAVADWHVNRSNVRAAEILIVCRCGCVGASASHTPFHWAESVQDSLFSLFFFPCFVLFVFFIPSVDFKQLAPSSDVLKRNTHPFEKSNFEHNCHLHLPAAINVSCSWDKWSAL